jgi:GH18 family chitinase
LWENLNPKGYLLTAYIPGKPKSLEKRYDMNEVWKYLDFMSLATFHFNGIYQKKTGINAPLKSSDHLNIVSYKRTIISSFESPIIF